MEPILFKGAPGSPYTRKMLALLRYQRLPYRFLIGNHDNDFGLPRALTLATAPRVFAWVDVMDDLSGLPVDEDGWLERHALDTVLRPLLAELGRTYVPVMLANARALNAGAERVGTTVDGAPWVQQAFPYQGRCVAALRTAYARLDEVDRASVDRILDETGCERLFL